MGFTVDKVALQVSLSIVVFLSLIKDGTVQLVQQKSYRLED